MKATKIITILLILLTGLQFAVFARGRAEDGSTVTPQRTPWGASADPLSEEEIVTLTGKIYFDNLLHPELRVGAREYELMIPRMYLYSVELEEGETVTVEGYKTEGAFGFMGRRFQEDEEDGEFILVTKATVDGVEWDLESDRYGYGGMGGMRGSRGMGGFGYDPRTQPDSRYPRSQPNQPAPKGRGFRW